MNIQQIISLSKQFEPSPENDRDWILQKIKSRATEGYWYIDVQQFSDMPGGGTFERFESVLKVLESEGFKVSKLSSFWHISWWVKDISNKSKLIDETKVIAIVIYGNDWPMAIVKIPEGKTADETFILWHRSVYNTDLTDRDILDLSYAWQEETLKRLE